MPTPCFDHDLRIDPVSEPLHRQTFIPELAVEAIRWIRSAKASRDLMKAVSIFPRSSHCKIAFETNSGP
jgi:hypothetical protein